MSTCSGTYVSSAEKFRWFRTFGKHLYFFVWATGQGYITLRRVPCPDRLVVNSMGSRLRLIRCEVLSEKSQAPSTVEKTSDYSCFIISKEGHCCIISINKSMNRGNNNGWKKRAPSRPIFQTWWLDVTSYLRSLHNASRLFRLLTICSPSDYLKSYSLSLFFFTAFGSLWKSVV